MQLKVNLDEITCHLIVLFTSAPHVNGESTRNNLGTFIKLLNLNKNAIVSTLIIRNRILLE